VHDLALYGAAAVALALGLHRFVAARRGRITDAMRHAYGFGLCLGFALLSLAPPTVRALHWTALPDLLGDLLRCAAACELALLSGALRADRPGSGAPEAHHRRHARREKALAAAVFTAAVLLWHAARIEPVAGQDVAPGGHRWLLAAYDAVVTGYITCCVGRLTARLAARARAARPGPTRTALRLIALGALAGVLWSAWGLDDVITAARTGLQSSSEDAVSAALGATCLGLVIAGAASSWWGQGRAALRAWRAAHRRYRALAPLWSVLRASFPEIMLLPARRLPPRDIRLALYRRVIEIHDARLMLGRHLDAAGADRVRAALREGVRGPARSPGADQPARGTPRGPAGQAADPGTWPGARRARPRVRGSSAERPRTTPRTSPRTTGAGTAVGDATVEAALLAVALRHVEAGVRPAGGGAGCWQRDTAVHDDLDAEADWLVRVAHAFTHCPHVAGVRARFPLPASTAAP
jgi:hypothetical protein